MQFRFVSWAVRQGIVLGCAILTIGFVHSQESVQTREQPRLKTPTIPVDPEPSSSTNGALGAERRSPPLKTVSVPLTVSESPEPVPTKNTTAASPKTVDSNQSRTTPGFRGAYPVGNQVSALPTLETPMIWQLSNAANSHFSSFFSEIFNSATEARSTTHPANEERDEKAIEPTTIASSDKESQPTKIPESVSLEEEAGDEESKLPLARNGTTEKVAVEITEDKAPINSSAKASEAKRESERQETVEAKVDTNAESKRPRPIKIPFGEPAEDSTTVAAPSRTNPPVDSLTELNDEKFQEEPVIDSKQAASGREEQGVDALQATKPSKRKRVVLIDDSRNSLELVPSESLTPLDPVQSNRLKRCGECLDYYLKHPESTSVRSPWAVMHALIAFGADYELQHGNTRVNAIGWMCHNGTCRTQRIFTPRGKGFIPNVGGGVQGHEGQFLAILAQCDVPVDYPIQVGANQFTVEDLVRYEMATCKERSELTFKLIGLSHYLDSNKQWRTNDGKLWSISKLIQEELAQPVVGSACGGTHRLMGFSFSVQQRRSQGEPINGQYARAEKFVKDYVDYTWRLQNPDGSFSTAWYEGRANEPNEERKVQTTGHMLEWLMFTLPDAEINQPRVQRSIDFLLSKIYDKKEHKWPIGPRGHATRAIALFKERFEEIRQTSPNLLQTTAPAKTAIPAQKQPFRK